MPAAPTPFHVLRAHSSPLSALSINPTNTLLYSGDQDGFIGITDLSSRRVVRYWQAHGGGILSLEEWNGHLISHGRDNKIKLHEPLKLSGRLRQDSEKNVGLEVLKELDVNALNFCRFAIASTHGSGIAVNGKQKEKEQEGILVIPSLLDSEYADVYHLPSFKRLHSSFNYVPQIKTPGASSSRTGLIMSLHCTLPFAEEGYSIKVAAGYEDGRVELWALPLTHDWKDPTDARTGDAVWEKLYDGKRHNEAIMAMVTNSTLTRAWTVSADHLLISYDLTSPTSDGIKCWSTGQIGHASVALSPNEKVIATGGWDGRIRLFSAGTGKPLGELSYHRESVHILAFANASALKDFGVGAEGNEVESTIEIGEESSDSEQEDESAESRERWLVSGGKDRRVALWSLMDFDR